MQYHVLPITKETLLQGFEDVVDPADPLACEPEFDPSFMHCSELIPSAPDGWHSDGTTTTTDTSCVYLWFNSFLIFTYFFSGNNVLTYKTTTTNTSPETGDDLVFNYTQNAAVAPTTTVNVNAACANIFSIHSLSS